MANRLLAGGASFKEVAFTGMSAVRQTADLHIILAYFRISAYGAVELAVHVGRLCVCYLPFDLCRT